MIVEFNTYEDIQAFFAAEGWGCKCCGELTSDAWWKCQGDTYCTRCKRALWNELRVRCTRVSSRQPGQAPATWKRDLSGFGHDYAANLRVEYARIHGVSAT